jgi:hypothetical protein
LAEYVNFFNFYATMPSLKRTGRRKIAWNKTSNLYFDAADDDGMQVSLLGLGARRDNKVELMDVMGDLFLPE